MRWGWRAPSAFPGQRVVRAGDRAIQDADDGRRGRGDDFGAFRPATGAAGTVPSMGRTTWVAFLEQVDAWLGTQDTASPRSSIS
jgi:hypothetical protein